MPKYYEDKEEDTRACAGIREDFKACLLQHDCVIKVTLTCLYCPLLYLFFFLGLFISVTFCEYKSICINTLVLSVPNDGNWKYSSWPAW